MVSDDASSSAEFISRNSIEESPTTSNDLISPDFYDDKSLVDLNQHPEIQRILKEQNAESSIFYRVE